MYMEQDASFLHKCNIGPEQEKALKSWQLQELPDNELYCPPITIRCVDCRNFGRYVLVGTHVINNINKFMYIPTTKTAKEAIKKFLGGKNKRPKNPPKQQQQQPQLFISFLAKQ